MPRKPRRNAEPPAPPPPPPPPDPAAPALASAARLHQAGRRPEAAGLCEGVLRGIPAHVGALRLLGRLRYEMGDRAGAASCFESLVAALPDDAAALNDLACVRLDQGRAAEALDLLDRALAAAPGNADIAFTRGNALLELGRAAEAAESYRAAAPGLAESGLLANNLARALLETGDRAGAEAAFRRATECAPDLALAHANLGMLLQQDGRPAEAAAAFRAALAIDPAGAETWNNLATALFDCDAPDEAMDCLDRALTLRPDFVLAHFNRGNALVKLHRAEAAVSCYEAALAIQPDYHEAAHNLGGALMMLVRPADAVPVFRAARRTQDDARALFAEGLACLTLGDLPAGFELYEARLRLDDISPLNPRHTIRPRWHGDAEVRDRRIVLHAEQGLGDTVQFCRYAPIIAARGAQVLLEAPMPLLPLLETLPGVAAFIPTGEDLPEFDLYCPMMSLPRACGTTLETVPGAVPYLREQQYRVARWALEMTWDGRPRVGIAWSGNPGFGNDRNRSIPLEAFGPLREAGVSLFVVQRDVREADRAVLSTWQDVTDLSNMIVDFADTAAILSLMDVVVSVDTSVAHVAGAIGRPVWVLLPYAGDFRWLTQREDSPWYPTARLFRQKQPRDWESVIARVAHELRDVR